MSERHKVTGGDASPQHCVAFPTATDRSRSLGALRRSGPLIGVPQFSLPWGWGVCWNEDPKAATGRSNCQNHLGFCRRSEGSGAGGGGVGGCQGSPSPWTSRWGPNWPGSEWHWGGRTGGATPPPRTGWHGQQDRQQGLWCRPVCHGVPRSDVGREPAEPLRGLCEQRIQGQVSEGLS